MIKKLFFATLATLTLNKTTFANYIEDSDMVEEFICENDCIVINSKDDVQEIFNMQVQNVIDLDSNNIIFNNTFHNDTDGTISGRNNYFNGKFINHGTIEGNSNIFKDVNNSGMFHGYNHTITGNTINDGAFFGDNFFIENNFTNTYYGIYDSFYAIFGEEGNNDSFTITNNGLFYGFENIFNYDFYNKTDGTMLGESHTFNKRFINEINGVLVGTEHKFNGDVNNDGEIYSNATDEDSGLIFNKNVINNGYFQGNFSKFEGETTNNGNIFGAKNTFFNLENNGNIYVDDILVNGTIQNGAPISHKNIQRNISLFNTDDTPTIYSNNGIFNGYIHNYGMLLGSNLQFHGIVLNDENGWIVGDKFTFNNEVTNKEFADIIGEHYIFNAKLQNYGAIDVVNGSFSNIQNFGEINAIAYNFNGTIDNNGLLSIDRSRVFKDIIDSSGLKTSELMASHSRIHGNVSDIGTISLNSSLIKNNNIVSADSINIQDSLIRSKSIKSNNIEVDNSLIYGNIQTNTLNATNTSFILHADKSKPLYEGFGGSIIVFDDISGGNNTLKINNLSTQGLDKYFIPLLIARSKDGIDESYFQVTTTKNLSVFGLDKKYYKFKKIGDFYVAGIGNDENLTQEKLSTAISTLQSTQQNMKNIENDNLISLINGSYSSEWDENVRDYDNLFYVGPDIKALNDNMSLMQNQINTLYVLQNNIFKRLGDIKNYKKDGIWARYYNGKISYENTTTRYNSKSIGFDKYDEYKASDGYFGIFIYDLHSDSTSYNSKSYGFGGYGSLFFNNGLFLDTTLRYTSHNNTSTSELFGQFYNNYYSILTSFEIGYNYDFLNNFYIKPNIEVMYLYHPQVSKKINNVDFIIDKASDTSFKLGINLGYDINKKFMIGAGSEFYFDAIKKSKYGIHDGYIKYTNDVNKNKMLKANILGSYYANKDLVFSFNFEKSFLSDFKLNYEANFNIRYHFNK